MKPPLAMKPRVQHFYHKQSGTLTYVVHAEPASDGSADTHCAIIDPVLDFNAAAGRTSHESADAVLDYVSEQVLTVAWILETHAHADHLSAAPYLREQTGGRVAIGKGITEVQTIFKEVFELEPEFSATGEQFDHLFEDGEAFSIGSLQARVMSTPGHTPACVTYVIGDAVFVGDTVFMPDSGTARADFPGGDAATLYRSIRKILDLPDDFRVFVCHDYQPNGRELVFEASVAEQAGENMHLKGGVDEAAYVELRTTRDATLSVPALLLPAIQVNIRAGHLPPPSPGGTRFLKLPLDRL